MPAAQGYKATREGYIRKLLLEAADAECSSSTTAPSQDISAKLVPACRRTPNRRNSR
jgi:hypothetical protein